MIRHLAFALVILQAGAGCASCQQPEPPPVVVPGCESCHAPTGEDGVAHGIEDAHPGSPLTCVECHGGDETASTKELAHVQPPEGVEGPSQVRSLTALELDAIDPAYLRWVNPTDYRVAEQSCGGSDCHQAIVETAPSSIMTTFAGHFNKTRYYSGAQDTRQPLVAVRDQVDVAYDGSPTSVPSLYTHSAQPVDDSSTLPEYLDHYLEKGCPRCHVWNFGSNEAAGDFRSSGCAGCHMVYRDDGLSQSEDPTANRDDPPHPARHELTSAIPDMQCEHCHYRGNRIGTMYRGVREQGRIGDPPNAERSVVTIHTRGPGFYIHDEDTTNDVDETPPDVHYSLGLGCVDCHVGIDVHGDGRLYGAHEYQVTIECEDCHGSPDAPIQPGEDGLYRTSGGVVISKLFTAAGGIPTLTGRLDGQDHVLKQLSAVQTSGSAAAIEAHGRYESGVSHLDSLECYACHTAWTQSCFGCHVTVDTRFDGKSLIDGTKTPGLVGGTRTWVALDYFPLGVGVDGKLTPMAPQEKMFVTVITPCDPAVSTCTESPDSATPGKRLFDQQVRRAADGTLGMGFGPVVPHTTSRGVQPCDRCHLREDESNWLILRETFGWGSERFVIPDGDGVLYDLTKVVDESTGQATVSLAHEGTGVMSPEMVQRMLIPRVPNSGLELQTFPPWEAP